MTHWGLRTGVTLLVATYLALGALVLFAPHPGIKAWAFAVLVPAPPWAMEIGILGFGAAIAADWGHGDQAPLDEQVEQAWLYIEDMYCDPKDLPWWC